MYQAFYVDRVKRYDFDITRNFPTISNWTSEKFRGRQKVEIDSGQFGKGRICDAIGTQLERVLMHMATTEIGEASEIDAVKKFASEFTTKSREVASLMVDLIKMAQEAPKSVVADSGFKTMLFATQQLFSANTNPECSSSQPTQSQFVDSDLQSETWSIPDMKAALEEIDKAIAERMDFTAKTGDIPNFSLGITQEFEATRDHLDNLVQNIADSVFQPIQVNVSIPIVQKLWYFLHIFFTV